MANISPIATFLGGFASHRASCQWASFDASGGISSGPYRYGNVSLKVGDAPFNVEWNRERIQESLEAHCLLSAGQVHGEKIYSLTKPIKTSLEVEGYDSLITNQTGVALMIQQADCQAILLFDPEQAVIAAVHVGWRGNVSNLIGKTIEEMTKTFHSASRDIQAFISPSLGPCCAEFSNYRDEFPTEFQEFMAQESHFNLWKISEKQLTDAGLQRKNISLAEICTSCHDNYFSYRRACRTGDGTTGRNCSAIVLER
ncbi:peptidoglycan editing factor PgeF [Desulfotalea psychrophila]|uniref:Purine nucleoside phosphorylase n=1 Tax=Desulfotalea psychrophila (strain LSv54 / DSM 12343) TaxID=177439 RepID=Q6AQP5_DESPS|nr:peptidoglycan editing factor PgeF [Desulfotalea psychrophila]CAG35328.1 conserved hypothetical protein [Desulfotalea psychrophila LSv54]